MKNIFLLCALLVGFSCKAQIRFKYPLNIAAGTGAGSSTYITIGGQDYKRTEIGFYYTVDSLITKSGVYDSMVTIYWQRDGLPVYTNVLDTMFYYTDSTKQVRNMGALRTWLRTYGY